MPTLHQVLLDILYLAASAAIAYLAKHVRAFVSAHTTSLERDTLARLAADAVPYVERLFPDLTGALRAGKAVAFVQGALARLHIPVTVQEIEAAVESAYADAKNRGLLAPYAASAVNAKKAATTK